jgi:diphthamide synthase subunit DPH2
MGSRVFRIHLFTACSRTLSITQITQHQTKILTNYEVEGIWKNEVVAYYKVPSRYLPGRTTKITKNLAG